MVGFCDLVGTGIAPVSKKTAVKARFKTIKDKARQELMDIQKIEKRERGRIGEECFTMRYDLGHSNMEDFRVIVPSLQKSSYMEKHT